MSYYPYNLVPPVLRKLFRGKHTNVIHHATCPKCGRQRVNIYKRGPVWRCSKCVPPKEGD